jgi:hypothetical protein
MRAPTPRLPPLHALGARLGQHMWCARVRVRACVCILWYGQVRCLPAPALGQVMAGRVPVPTPPLTPACPPLTCSTGLAPCGVPTTSNGGRHDTCPPWVHRQPQTPIQTPIETRHCAHCPWAPCCTASALRCCLRLPTGPAEWLPPVGACNIHHGTLEWVKLWRAHMQPPPPPRHPLLLPLPAALPLPRAHAPRLAHACSTLCFPAPPRLLAEPRSNSTNPPSRGLRGVPPSGSPSPRAGCIRGLRVRGGLWRVLPRAGRPRCRATPGSVGGAAVQLTP